MPTILLIDDEPAIQHAFRKAFHPPQFDTITARTAVEGLRLLVADRPDVVVLDVHLPDADGLQAFDRVKETNVRVPVVLITGHGTTDLAIEAMKRGAFDYLLKPLRYEQLKEIIERACASSRLMTTPAVVADAEPVPDRADALVGQCEAMQEVYKASARRGDGRDRTDSGESGPVRNWSPGHLPALEASGQVVSRDQLRGHPGEPDRERTVRAREGCIHRCRSETHRQV